MPKPKIKHPFYPIIYVRGYAMTKAEIEATVSTPYMGFNLGATKVRQDWRRKVIRHIFESPLVRLMKKYDYRDIYAEGKEMQGTIPAKSIIIHRYYEQADTDLGTGHVPSVIEAAEELHDLVIKVRDQVCGTDLEALAAFKVYLVAHSMGGLVCRCFLQNPGVGTPISKGMVDKVYTYATPHNGIEMGGINVPSFLGIWDMNNFSRPVMADYLALPPGSERVDTLNNAFDPQRFFCLVGTNHKDYEVAGGISRRLAGEMSDGLVRIENAVVAGAPRAFVYRSHSGPYGIVNSEEGYQNLIRFLFGDVKVTGILEVEELPLPPSVKREYNKDKDNVRASYFFEATVAPRGTMTYKLTERRKETFSAVFREFDEMLRLEKTELNRPRFPVLFSVFLDTKLKAKGSRSMIFSIDLAVSTTGYEIDGILFFNKHIPGEFLFRNTLSLRARETENGWNVRYSTMDDSWGESTQNEIMHDDQGYYIPLASKKGFKGRLRLKTEPWS